MTDTVIAAGKDAWIWSTTASESYPEPKRPRLISGVARAFVLLPYRQQVLGKPIASAVLSCPVRGSWAAQTVTVGLVSEKWGPGTVTWNNQPSLNGQTGDLQPALSDGERFEVDVTSLVSTVAAGFADYGFRVVTDSAADNRLYGFASGEESWRLDIEYSDEPEPPTILAPLGGSTDLEPVISWEAGDFGDEVTEQTSSRVQVNAGGPDAVTPDYDTGYESNIYSERDLSVAPGFTCVDGTTYYARVALNGSDNWSDWISWSAESWAVGQIDNPGATAWDPSLTLAASVTGGNLRKHRFKIFNNETGVLRYDSMWLPGNNATAVEHQSPTKWRDKVVHRSETVEYRVDWLYVDRNDRTPNGDDPGWRTVSQVYSFNDDAIPTPPTDLTVAQIGDTCWTEWAWERTSGVSTAWIAGIGDTVIARIDPSDVETAGTSHTWRTPAVPAYTSNLCWIRAVDDEDGHKTEPAEYAFTYELTGTWLADEDDFDRTVMLLGNPADQMRNFDRRAIYSPVGSSNDIDIVYALGGLSSDGVVLGFDSSRGRDWEADLATLRWMRTKTDRPFRFAYGTVNKPFILRNVTPGVPAPDFLPANVKHAVQLGVHQVGEHEGED